MHILEKHDRTDSSCSKRAAIGLYHHWADAERVKKHLMVTATKHTVFFITHLELAPKGFIEENIEKTLIDDGPYVAVREKFYVPKAPSQSVTSQDADLDGIEVTGDVLRKADDYEKGYKKGYEKGRAAGHEPGLKEGR